MFKLYPKDKSLGFNLKKSHKFDKYSFLDNIPYDISGNGYNGTNVDCTITDNDGIYIVSANKYLYAPVTNVDFSSTNVGSMYIHCKRTASNKYMAFGQSVSYSARFLIQGYSDGKYYVYANNGSSSFYGYVTLPNITFQKLVLVYDGTGVDNNARLKFYVDGELKTLGFSGGSAATSLGNLVSSPLRIGRDRTTYSTGYVKECAAWNRTLSIEEIQAL